MKLMKKEKMKLAGLRRMRLGKSPEQIFREKIYKFITFIIIAAWAYLMFYLLKDVSFSTFLY